MRSLLSRLYWYVLWQFPSRNFIIPTSLFCICFNIYSRKYIKSSSVTINSRHGIICISELLSNGLKLKVFIHDKLRARAANYFKGIHHRALEIAQIYGLDNLNYDETASFVDCGANLGDLLQYFVVKSIPITYLAFEPGPFEYISLINTADYYSSLLHRDNIIIENYALGNRNKTSSLYYVPAEADSSLLATCHQHSTVAIEQVRLDSHFTKYLDCSDSLILKVEAEGFEPEVLYGSRNILSNCTYILVDMGPERGLTQQCTLSVVINYLYFHHFRMTLFTFPPRIVGIFEKMRQDV